MSGVQILIGYSDVFSDEVPDLKEEIKCLNMHKSISIICELIRIRDANMDPIRTWGAEIRIPFETVLKKQMCGLNSNSPEEMFSNLLFRKDIHIISVQMLLTLLKKIIIYGNYETMDVTNYEVTESDYKDIIKLQLVVAEEIARNHSEEIDTDHFLYSTYHLNYKRNLSHEILRMYYMLEVIGRDKTNFEEDVQKEYRDYYTSFTTKYGFTLSQYSAILFWELKTYYTDINGLIYDTMWQNLGNFYDKTEIKELAIKVISTLSQTVENYIEWAEESQNQEWDFSKFFKYPFIADTIGNHISLSDITLINAFFEKTFWLIRDCYPKKDRGAMAFFGRLFEKYIQELAINAVNQDYVYIEEFTYNKKKDRKKSSDVYIRSGENLLVVEAKGFSVLLDCMTKNERIEDNNDKLFVDPVLQADMCLDEVMEEKKDFAGVENAYIVSVTMDNINAVPNYYNAIHSAIKKRKKSQKTKCFFNFNIEEYEMLMYLLEQKCNIFALLNDYYENTQLKPFSTYLQEKYPEVGRTTFMEKLFKEKIKGIRELYF